MVPKYGAFQFSSCFHAIQHPDRHVLARLGTSSCTNFSANQIHSHFHLIQGTDFEGGFYHGRILLPIDYPFKPPNIVFLTPNGRFEAGKKICLSISAHHPEEWQAGVCFALFSLLVIFSITRVS